MNNIEEIIINKIKESGPITFADYMDTALYHQDYGYYSSGITQIGKEGDFYTSPHVHSAFGEVIANFILQTKKYIETDTFTVLEIGSGKGYLSYDILNHIESTSPHYKSINYIIIEKNKSNLISGLEKYKDKVKIYNNISEIEHSITGIIISNELFDSLPFHKLIYKDKKLNEYYVDYVNGAFNEIKDSISDNSITSYLEKYKLNFSDSKQMEVCLEAGKYIKQLNSILTSGIILTIDYGFLSEELFSNEKPEGTYRCFYNHTVNSDIFSNIGDQDITADVDFSNLIITGHEVGLEKLKYTTQAQFLVDWGILDIYEKAIKENNKGLNAIKNLFMPGMMGNYFKVLIQKKKIELDVGFYKDSELKISFGIS